MKNGNRDIRNLRNKYLRYVGIVIIIVSIACLFPALKLKYYYEEIDKIIEPTYATVVENLYGSKGYRKDICVYVVNGQRYYKSFGLKKTEIGKRINITYDPSNPEMATLLGHSDSYYNRSCVQIFLFIVAGVCAIIWIIDKYSDKKRYYLKKSNSRKT